MSLLNRAKIRPDVLKMLDESQEIFGQAIAEFLKQEENKSINFQALFQESFEKNANIIKRAANDEEYIDFHYELYTKEEMEFFAKLFRFTSEFAADV